MMSIKEKFDEFVRNNGHEPLYCGCYVRFLDDGSMLDVIIKMSHEVVDEEDDKIFFNCGGLNDIISMTEVCGEDFVIIAETISFYDCI